MLKTCLFFVNVKNLDMKHEDYIKSKKWRQLKALVLKRDNNTCQDCKVVEAKEIHHLHYKNYLNENLEDLVSLCRVCHGKRHGIKKSHLPVNEEEKIFDGVFSSYSEMIHSEIDRINEKDNYEQLKKIQTQDDTIRLMAKLPPAVYTVKPSQLPMLIEVWDVLHWYDRDHEYTLNESRTKVRKDKR